MKAFATATDPRSWTDAHLHAWDAATLAAPWFAQAPHFALGQAQRRFTDAACTRSPFQQLELELLVARRQCANQFTHVAPHARRVGRRGPVIDADDHRTRADDAVGGAIRFSHRS
jgi:hypothetical protein